MPKGISFRVLRAEHENPSLTNLSVFADICQPFTLLRFCTKFQPKIYVFLCVHNVQSNGGKSICLCGFNPFTMLRSRQISVFGRSH